MSFNCPNCTIICDTSQYLCLICGTVFNNEQINDLKEADRAEEIIQTNYLKAYETIPEYFFPKELIYLEGKINNIPRKFLLDTGATVSVMSFQVMEDLNLTNILDRRFSGQMIGVGSKSIEGKIHYIEILFDFGYVPSSFNIIKDINTIILGMDFIMSHGMILDFNKKQVIIGNNKLDMKV